MGPRLLLLVEAFVVITGEVLYGEALYLTIIEPEEIYATRRPTNDLYSSQGLRQTKFIMKGRQMIAVVAVVVVTLVHQEKVVVNVTCRTLQDHAGRFPSVACNERQSTSTFLPSAHRHRITVY